MKAVLPRLALDAIAGIGGTIVMTAVMRRLSHRLPSQDRYPLPPREIVERVLPLEQTRAAEPTREHLTLLSHFGYGAATAALFSALSRNAGVLSGAGYGAFVWAISYLGWIPAGRILVSARSHPPARNGAMILAHLAWGAVTALTLRELNKAQREVFDAGRMADALGKETLRSNI